MLVLSIGYAAATSTIKCASQQREWCRVYDSLENLTDDEKLTIENVSHKDNVKNFQWLQKSNLKHIPAVIFETFPSLKLLDLLTDIEELRESDFANAKKLEYLYLMRNHIQRVPSNVFKHASNILTITLNVNSITDVQDFAFKGLNKLYEVTLDFNYISSLKKNTFAGAPKLITISLKNNEITSIEDGTFDLPRLDEILLNSNRLQSLPDRLFANAPQLTHVDLTDNRFTQLPAALSTVPKLDTLVLDWNQLENVQISDFAGMEKLDFLSVENTGVTIPTTDQPKPSKSALTQIDLTDNALADEDILKHLSMFGNLEGINLSNNKFARINDLSNVKKLFENITKIDLEGNEVDCSWLKEVLPQMKNMEIEFETGDQDTDFPDDDKREVVDGQFCGKFQQ